MELALESYDLCIGLLQSKPKSPEGKHYTISLPNLRADAAISVEEVQTPAPYSAFLLFVVLMEPVIFLLDILSARLHEKPNVHLAFR